MPGPCDPLPQHPSYAAAFECIGPACEDHCCGDWQIPLDRRTYQLYRAFPPGSVAERVAAFVHPNPPPQPDPLFARIDLGPHGLCPFFSQERLCAIQHEHGPALLSSTCSIYPRSLSQVGTTLEGSLSLSCPEAARRVLLSPSLLQTTANLHSGAFRTDNIFQLDTAAAKPASLYLPIRNAILELLQNRTHPLTTRLLQVGALCQALEVSPTGETTMAETLTRSMEPPPTSTPNPRKRLDTVFRLSQLLLENDAAPRFQQNFWTFVEGISDPNPEAPAQDDLSLFLHAQQAYFEPFFTTAPEILENYLLNYIFQNLFPYGRSGSDRFQSRTIFAEYLRFATHFAWITGLLTGIAARHRQAFSTEHVIHAVQSFTRALEHDPNILPAANQYLKAHALNTLEGAAILLG